MAATAMDNPAAISAYSIAVAPRLSLTHFFNPLIICMTCLSKG